MYLIKSKYYTMTEQFKLPPRKSSINKIEAVKSSQLSSKLYKNEHFQIGVLTGVLSTIFIILFSLLIIGFIGAASSF